MAFHVYAFLLVVFLILFLALLWRLSWLHLQPAHARGGAKRATLQRLLKPRSPLDCSACRRASTASSAGGLASAPVRPWCEVKSRRGAPKRINTEGFACPNQQCRYFGITDPRVHALVGDGKHGRAEQIQTFRGPACRTTFTARRHTPMYRLKTPSHQIAMVLSALAEGLDPSAAERVFGFRQATITTWLSRAGEHAHILHESFFCQLLWWLLLTSVLKIDDFALYFYMFFELWHAPMKRCTSISCVSIDHTGGYAVHPLLQWETRGWKFLPGSSKTRRYAELSLFKYYSWSLEVLKPLVGTRGVTHPGQEPR
jgi:hypothetical protein